MCGPPRDSVVNGVGIVTALTMLALSIEGAFDDEADYEDSAASYDGGIFLAEAATRRIAVIMVLVCLYVLLLSHISKAEFLMYVVYWMSALFWAAGDLSAALFHGTGALIGIWWLYVFGSNERRRQSTPAAVARPLPTSGTRPQPRHTLVFSAAALRR